MAFAGVQVVPVTALARKPAKRGYLELFSTTVGAELLVDGKLKGIVPLEGRIALKPGKRDIEVRLRGYLSHQETVRIRNGRTTELEVDLIAVDGIVTITTPGLIDATIRVDGEIIGSTPFDGSIPAGDHSLEISREGYETEVRELRVQAGKVYRIDVRMAAAQKTRPTVLASPGFPVDSGNVAASGPVASGPSDPFYETWWFWTLTGLAVTGAATGVVLGVGLETEVEAPFDHRVALP